MTTTDTSSLINQFDRLAPELVEKVLLSISYDPPSSTLHPSCQFYRYNVQKPLLERTICDLHACALTCRRFHSILTSPSFWLHKCRQDKVLPLSLPSSFRHFATIYKNNPFHPDYNLLEDSKWIKKSSNTYGNGGSYQIESVPVGADRLYDLFNQSSSCRATSYTWACFEQRDLPILRPDEERLSTLRPVIEFSVCVAARWDCASRFRVSLTFSDGHKWQCEKRFAQWNDKHWHRITYRYAEYTNLPAQVESVEISGKDDQGWAGYYGTKFALAGLRLAMRKEGETTKNGEVIEDIQTSPLDLLAAGGQPQPVVVHADSDSNDDEDDNSFSDDERYNEEADENERSTSSGESEDDA